MRRAIALLTRVAFLGSLFTTGCIDAIVGEVDVCTYEGKGYAAGEKFTASDGCNSCSCAATGEVSCTEIACSAQDGGNSSSGGGTCKAPDGKIYKIGETFKNDCNTCSCTEQGAACTLIGCISGDSGAGMCQVNGKTYKVGETFQNECNSCACMPNGEVACTGVACAPSCNYLGKQYRAGATFLASDGCNSCTCGWDGKVACTDRACSQNACYLGGTGFPVGSSVICPDGCNQCACVGPGKWASNAALCPDLPKVEKCPNDSAYVDKARVVYLTDHTLAVEATIAGCANEGQKFKLCHDGTFRESQPVQTTLFIVNESTPTCSALPTGTRVFDISPLAEAYKQAYQTQSGAINVQLEKGDSFEYKF